VERQDLSCTYLAHHELESILITIVKIIIIVKAVPARLCMLLRAFEPLPPLGRKESVGGHLARLCTPSSRRVVTVMTL